jgi:hypothetical protein
MVKPSSVSSSLLWDPAVFRGDGPEGVLALDLLIRRAFCSCLSAGWVACARGLLGCWLGWSISNSVVGLCTYIQLGEGCVDLSDPSVLSFVQLKMVHDDSVLLFTLLWTTDTR